MNGNTPAWIRVVTTGRMRHFSGKNYQKALDMYSFYRGLTHVVLVLVLVLPITSLAIDSENNTIADTAAPGSEKSLDQLAAEMSNPLAAFTSFAYGLDYRTYQGEMPDADDQSSTTHILQAVIPFAQKDGQGFVLRLALPYVDDQPIYWVNQEYSKKGYAEWLMRQQDPTVYGQGYWDPTHGHTDDLATDLVYGGVDDNGFILQYGLAGRFPTSSDTSNARQQLILGPEINVGRMADWGTYGALVSHVIDIAEKRDKGTPDTTITTIDAYFSYALSNGWQLFSSPKITYDWEGDGGNKLAIPIGGGFAKTTRIGRMPLRVAAEIQKYVVSTDRFSSDWFFKLSITPVLSNKYTRN
jgi:hypothetical protein